MSSNKKDDLRRLMQSQKLTSGGQDRKIDSPFARYNSVGQLSCLVCNCPVKNEVLWKTHVLKKEHKMNVERYKAQMVQKPDDSKTSKPSPQKRKSPDSELSHGKEKLRKLSNPPFQASVSHQTSANNSQDSSTKSLNSSSSSKAATSLTTNIQSQYSDDSNESDMEVDVIPNRQMSLPHPTSGSSSFPPVTSNDRVNTSLLDNKAEPPPPALPEGLPEGFIDDPVMDAKVRNVPYKDKMEEQLELFQKEMKQQQTVSEALLAEDDEKREEERQLYEVEEQMHNWSKILRAVEKKNQLATTSTDKQQLETMDDKNEDSDDEDDDGDYGLDWRAKKVFRK